jgi:hypothetical protein
MTEAEVKVLLGVPHHIRHDGPGTTAFYYEGFRRLKSCNMEIYFGADDRVTGRFHDY